MTETMSIPRECNACHQPLLLANLFVDDGCPCNSARGVNLTPLPCALCRTDDCVKPGHRLVPFNTLAEHIHGLNRKWWYDGDRALPRNKGELLMLVVTEIAEGFEGERKGLMDDKLPHRPMAEVELVDAIVRILDYAGAYGYDLDGAFREKLAYNAERKDHKSEAKKIAEGNPLECKAGTTPIVNGEPYCLDCGGRPGDHSPECTKGDLAIKVPTKQEPCVCGHDRVEHHPCGSCEHDCTCLDYRAAKGGTTPTG